MLQVGCTCGCTVHVWPCPWAANPTQVVTTPTPLQGWICPVCKGGNSPFAARCPCVPALPASYTIIGQHIGGFPTPHSARAETSAWAETVVRANCGVDN
jgi:hypothetical protein